MTVDTDWIDYWAGDYDASTDDLVLNDVGPRVRQRGYYDRNDFLTVRKWKSARVLSRLGMNTDRMIRDITVTALAAPEPIQHLVLTLLNGVSVPMASALLMVWEPEVHTVIDARATNSLVVNCEIADPSPRRYPPYMAYLTVCRQISERSGRGLRTVDRALYLANGRPAGDSI